MMSTAKFLLIVIALIATIVAILLVPPFTQSAPVEQPLTNWKLIEIFNGVPDGFRCFTMVTPSAHITDSLACAPKVR